MEDRKIPLLGVMGAFVFAAQMINFPVGPGTSGHLVGGALLTIALGPAAASIVMTAILAIQALVFQDGGILALGANIFNMAIAGVLAAYLPYRLWANVVASVRDFRGRRAQRDDQRMPRARGIDDFRRSDAAARAVGVDGPVFDQRGNGGRDYAGGRAGD